ncbi:MAG: hypothetical protein FD123_604 [Bacteroidetes bacterium]|nr:MAG: hypothetical protein FD123_604 [Bacteroidota bacterium]
MKKLLSAAAAFILVSAVSAQNFEGTIEFKKFSEKDTISYIYHVKGDKVRIDEIGARSKKVEGSFLIDLKAGTTRFLSHDRQTWGEHKPSQAPAVTGTPKVEKTSNVKTIQGYKCTEYIVKSTEEGTKISYWMTSGKFTFFKPMLKLLNRKEKFSIYYQLLPVKDGAFSLAAIQTDLSGKETGRLEVTKITKKTVDAAQFTIPKEYKEFK